MQEALWNYELVLEFRSFLAGSEDTTSDITFESILSLFPFIGKIFIDLGSIALEEVWFLVVSIGKLFLVENSDSLNYDRI